MKNLFDAVEMKNLRLKNRLIRSATWEGIADDGSIDENTYKIYSELAKGQYFFAEERVLSVRRSNQKISWQNHCNQRDFESMRPYPYIESDNLAKNESRFVYK